MTIPNNRKAGWILPKKKVPQKKRGWDFFFPSEAVNRWVLTSKEVILPILEGSNNRNPWVVLRDFP